MIGTPLFNVITHNSAVIEGMYTFTFDFTSLEKIFEHSCIFDICKFENDLFHEVSCMKKERIQRNLKTKIISGKYNRDLFFLLLVSQNMKNKKIIVI